MKYICPTCSFDHKQAFVSSDGEATTPKDGCFFSCAGCGIPLKVDGKAIRELTTRELLNLCFPSLVEMHMYYQHIHSIYEKRMADETSHSA